MGHRNSKVHRGGKPGPRKRNLNFRPEADVEQAIADWCRVNGVDPASRGATTRALTALVRAGRNAFAPWWDLGDPRPDLADVLPAPATAPADVDLAAAAERGIHDVQMPASDAPSPTTWPTPGRDTPRCPAGGKVRSWHKEAWTGSHGLCPDCGAECDVWVRGTDLFPRAKVRAHRIPEGVDLADVQPFAAHRNGGPSVPAVAHAIGER